MLLVLGILLAVVAMRMLKQHSAGSTILLGAISVAALMSAGTGVKLIFDAQASGIASVLTFSGGGTVTITANEFNYFTNTSGTEQQIKSMTLPSNCSNRMIYGTQCTIGLVLQNNDRCEIDCTVNP